MTIGFETEPWSFLLVTTGRLGPASGGGPRISSRVRSMTFTSCGSCADHFVLRLLPRGFVSFSLLIGFRIGTSTRLDGDLFLVGEACGSGCLYGCLEGEGGETLRELIGTGEATASAEPFLGRLYSTFPASNIMGELKFAFDFRDAKRIDGDTGRTISSSMLAWVAKTKSSTPESNEDDGRALTGDDPRSVSLYWSDDRVA